MVDSTDQTPEQASAALVARIQRIAEREMDAVERVLDALGPAENADADRTARTLAGISRTLREVVALTTRETVAETHDPDDDTIPVDIDALRCELARRINALIDARAEQPVGDRDRDAGASETRG
jgi:sugar-specific transcriptional regulator TrmB